MNKRGFTLIEIIIAMTIMAIVMSVAIPSFIEFKKKREIKMASRIIVDVFKLAQSSAKLKKIDRYVVFAPEGLKIVEETESLGAVSYETVEDWVHLPGHLKYRIESNSVRDIPFPDDKSTPRLLRVIKFDKTTGFVSGSGATVFLKDKPVIVLSKGTIKYV